MDEDYIYLKAKNIDELIIIVENNLDMDETNQAMLELWDKNEDKALQEGIKLLVNNEGDQYFQASIFNIIYDVDFIKVMDSLLNRNSQIEFYLLNEIMKKMVEYSKYNLDEQVKFKLSHIEYVNKQYEDLCLEEKKKIYKQHNEFSEEFKSISY